MGAVPERDYSLRDGWERLVVGGAEIANLRESYAAAALASLEWSPERERAIDRIAAAGKADKLGIEIWRCKYSLESKAYRNAARMLQARFQERYRSEMPFIAEACTLEALGEFLGPACSMCNGARELITESLKVICETC